MAYLCHKLSLDFPAMSGTKLGKTRSASGIVRPGEILAINRLVLLVAAPLFLVLAVVALLAFRFAAGERDAQSWVRHTYQVMEAERRLQDDVQTAETGMRGFVLSRDPSFPKRASGPIWPAFPATCVRFANSPPTIRLNWPVPTGWKSCLRIAPRASMRRCAY